MSWIEGTATDYRDMLDQVIEIVTSDYVSAVAIVSGGTGFAVDDIITITDGTKTHSATLRVTSVSGGVIDGIQMEQGGAYTVDPDLTATTAWTVAPSGGASATFDLTMTSEPWTVERRSQEAVSATVATAGNGYNVGDLLTLTMDGGGILGATGYGVAPVFAVATLTGAAGTGVATVTLDTAGHLEVVPDTDGGTGGNQANSTNDGSGDNAAVLTVTYQDVDATEEDVVVLNAPGEGGSEDILMAIRTHQENDVSGFDTVYNWQLFGLYEWNAALALHEQQNISYGMSPSTGVRQTDGGVYFTLKPNDADPDITFWMSVTNRRIILVCKTESASVSHYPSMYMGLLNPFGTSTEVPYPLWIQGSTSRPNSRFDDTEPARVTGLSDAYVVSTMVRGPAAYRYEGAWEAWRNFRFVDTGSPTKTAEIDYCIWPVGYPTFTPQPNDILTAAAVLFEWNDIFPPTGIGTAPNYQLRPTPDSGDDARPLFPLTPYVTNNEATPTLYQYEPLGELDNCYWISASDGTADLLSEDVQKIGDVRYIVFQNGNQVAVHNFFCLKVE